MLISLGIIFIFGVFSINPVTSSISIPIVTLKNCTHMKIQTEVNFVTASTRVDVGIASTSGLKINIGAVKEIDLQVRTEYVNNGFNLKTELITSKSSLVAFTDPFNFTVLFSFPENSVYYKFSFSILAEQTHETSYFGKSNCTSSVTSDIVCENDCLCDTVIYKRCANGDRVNGTCSDPGTLFQSPGNLTFGEECPPVICNTTSLLVNNLLPISSHSVNVKPNETVMFQCNENRGYKGNIATYNCSDHGSFILISNPANCFSGLSPGAIAGIVIGVIVGLIIIVAVVYFVLQKKKKVEYPKSAEESPLKTTTTT